MGAYRIVLADDHGMFRRGIRKILEEQDGIEIVGEASDGIELLKLLKKVTTHMVILDISMPNMRGIEATSEIKNINSGIKVLILTMHTDRDYLYHAVSAGAEGFLLKQDADSELFSAIKEIRQGRTYVSPIISADMTDDFIRICRGDSKPMSDPLTLREREVLKLIADGKSNKEVAGILYLSIRTVETHRANLMDKLNLKSTAALVKYAILRGYTQ
jgi:DNA-binding NarL/FixJ family response regulator